MKLIVGLGNPGTAYQETRHNIGFLVVKELARSQKAEFKRGLFASSLTAKIKLKGASVVLAMPLTFMNLSGIAVKALAKKYKAGPGDLLVVCDDLDLDFGRQKIRPGGSSGGQRGLQSIIGSLDCADFARLRVGIGRPHKGMDAADFVLLPFAKNESVELKCVIEKAAEAAASWAVSGITETMNVYNKKEREE